MAKKYNRGRQQKRNISREKLDKYREEIAKELGVELPPKKRTGSTAIGSKSPRFDLDANDPLL